MTRRACGGMVGGGALAVMWALSFAACSGGGTGAKLDVSGPSDTEKRYTDQAPLSDPPAIDPSQPGAAYLSELAPYFQPAWHSFLEDCRLRLPPSDELNTESLQVVLDIVMNVDGEIVAVRTIQSSSNETFDQVATEIARDLERLPRAPSEWLSDDERVHLHWSFARDSRQAGAASASLARVHLPLDQALPKLLAAGQYASAAHRLADGDAPLDDALVAQLASAIVNAAASANDRVLSPVALETIATAKLVDLAAAARLALRSSEVEVAVAAARALAAVGGEQDTPLLTAYAAGKGGARPNLSAAAAGALLALGKSAQLASLAAANIKSDDPASREAALAVYSELARPEAVAALSEILSRPESARAEKSAAAKALGKQASVEPLAIKALLAGAGAGDAAIRSACVTALADAARAGLRNRLAYWKAIELLKDKDERVRASAILAASQLDSARFAGELSNIKAGGSELVLLSFARALQFVPGPVALARLLDLTAVDHLGMREAATVSLLAHKDDKARQRLHELVADSSAELRLAALPSLDSDSALEGLLGDASTEVQAAAMATLTARKGRSATSRLLVDKLAASHDSPQVQLRWASAWLRSK